jgi:ABC-type dipeptide/oligopeptide/nickel transport system permease subunit
VSTADTVSAEAAVLLAPAKHPPHRIRLLQGLLRDRTAIVGLVLVGLLTLVAIFAPLLASHDPNAVDVARKFLPPSREFPLGTDHLGRDVWARIAFGARLSIGSTLLASLVISFIGVLVGLVAGWFGGLADTLISRVVDILLAFPTFLLALAITAILGPGLRNVLVAIILAWWASYARIVRSAVLAEKDKPYIEAARATGTPSLRVLFRHLFPNIVAPLVVLTTLDLGAVLLSLSGFSFLGLGVKPPTAEWGSMLNDGRTYLSRAPNMMFFPGAAIFLMVLGFNLLGDGLRDVLDPRTRSGRR